jgi:hypothetical protein
MSEETIFTIEAEGVPVRVRYCPHYFATMGLAHMEFRSASEPPKPIPISATGYRSHFCAPEAVAQLGTPEAYATAYCKAMLRKRRGEEASLQEILAAAGSSPPGGQLALFE